MKLFMKFFCLAAIMFGGLLIKGASTAAESEFKETHPKKKMTISNESPINVNKIYIAAEYDDNDKEKRKKVAWRQIDIKDHLAGGNGNGVLEQGEEMEVVDVEDEYIQIRAQGVNRADEEVQAIIRRVHFNMDIDFDVPLSENQFRPR